MQITFLSGACIENEGKILLLKQSSTARHPNRCGPRGGHMEKGENLIQTAIREIKEETNLNIDIIGLVESGVNIHKDKSLSIIALYYALANNINELKQDRKKVAGHLWASEKDLIKDIYPLRDPLIKPILIKAVNKVFVPRDFFKIHLEK